MEKKKLLLVAVSVGVFLVIAISAAILIFTPKISAGGPPSVTGVPSAARPPGTSFTPGVNQTSEITDGTTDYFDPVDILRDPPHNGIGGIPPAANTGQETPASLSREQPGQHYPGAQSGGGGLPPTTINVPSPATPGVPKPPAESRPQSPPAAAPSVAVRQAPAASKPAAPKSTAPKSDAADRPASKSTDAAAKPAAQKARSDYWIQTGSFGKKSGAEAIQETLAQKGITSIIHTVEKNGTLYRVWVGPYTSETEANYWLPLVRSINGFAGSFVYQSRSQR
jgi:DedD protein